MMKQRTLKEQIEIYWQKQLGEVLKTGATYTVLTQLGLGIEFLGKCLDTETPWDQIGFSETHFNLALTELKHLNKYKSYANIESPKDKPGVGQLNKISVASFCTDTSTYAVEKIFLERALSEYSKQVTDPVGSVNDAEKVRDLLDGLLVTLHHIDLKSSIAGKECDRNISDARQIIDTLKSVLTLPSKTNTTQFNLYKCLRCGMAHAGFPGYKLKLTSRTEMEIYEDGTGYIVIDATKLYKDFNDACNELFVLATERPELQARLNDVVMEMEEVSYCPPPKQPEVYSDSSADTFPSYDEPHYDETSACKPNWYQV